jgi:CBS domain-containing protein
MTITARELMQESIVLVAPEDPLIGVQRLFADEMIHGAPVVDEQNRVLGVITTSDLLQAIADDRDAAYPTPGYFEDGVASFTGVADQDFQEALGERRVAGVMTRDIVSVSPRASISEIARTLRHNHVHRVLVIEDDVLVGIITTFDLIELLEKDSGGQE